MNILIVTDAYPPMRTSGACHIYDLGQAFIKDGLGVSVIVPNPNQILPVVISLENGIEVVRVRAMPTKDVGYIRRTLSELINPYLIWTHLKTQSKFINQKFDGVVWYSPTIFWGALIRSLKKFYGIKSYLILRDIFPDWALDLGLIKKGPIYFFMKAIERYQYHQADIIGVQSPNNLIYFNQAQRNAAPKAEVLWNWIGESNMQTSCSINLSKSNLAGRVICVYAGNMGVAQGIDSLFDLAASLKDRDDLGFVFVGRGSEVERLRNRILSDSLSNILIFDEIDSNEIPGLYMQCKIGLVTLDFRHRAYNIPGKWLGYLQFQLQTFALINPGNDMVNLINSYNLGYVSTAYDLEGWKSGLLDLVEKLKNENVGAQDMDELIQEKFSARTASSQILTNFRKLQGD